MTMYGQAKSLDNDLIQEEVNKCLETNSPYEPFVPSRIYVRKYLQYMEENGLTDPHLIPEEVLDSFMKSQENSKIAV